LRHFA